MTKGKNKDTEAVQKLRKEMKEAGLGPIQAWVPLEKKAEAMILIQHLIEEGKKLLENHRKLKGEGTEE